MGDGLRRAKGAAEMTQLPVPVKPGQIWADNDPREPGRTIRVERIEGDQVICTTLTNSDRAQSILDNWAKTEPGKAGERCLDARDARGRTTKISIKRFRTTASGYRLVESGSRLAGHGLQAEGKPHAWSAYYGAFVRTTGKEGVALCSCGTPSPPLDSDAKRKRWHAGHKNEIRAQLPEAG